MIGTNLLRYYEGEYVIWDLETERASLRFNRPWLVGWLIADNRGIIERKLRYIWWDDLRMSPGAIAKTRFNYLEYKRLARPALEVLEEFDADLYSGRVPVGHNLLGFDIYIHDYWRSLLGKPQDWSYVPKVVDTHLLSKAYLKGIKIDPEQRYEMQVKLGNLIEKGLKTNLEHMGKTLKIDFDSGQLHRADADIELNYHVFKELIGKMDV